MVSLLPTSGHGPRVERTSLRYDGTAPSTKRVLPLARIFRRNVRGAGDLGGELLALETGRERSSISFVALKVVGVTKVAEEVVVGTVDRIFRRRFAGVKPSRALVHAEVVVVALGASRRQVGLRAVDRHGWIKLDVIFIMSGIKNRSLKRSSSLDTNLVEAHVHHAIAFILAEALEVLEAKSMTPPGIDGDQ